MVSARHGAGQRALAGCAGSAPPAADAVGAGVPAAPACHADMVHRWQRRAGDQVPPVRWEAGLGGFGATGAALVIRLAHMCLAAKVVHCAPVVEFGQYPEEHVETAQYGSGRSNAGSSLSPPCPCVSDGNHHVLAAKCAGSNSNDSFVSQAVVCVVFQSDYVRVCAVTDVAPAPQWDGCAHAGCQVSQILPPQVQVHRPCRAVHGFGKQLVFDGPSGETGV